MIDFDGFPTPRKETTLNLTAMIDIIMVLLLFFITTTTFSKLGVKINQPESTQARAVEKRNVVEIGISKTGDLFFDQKPLTESELADAIKHVVERNPNAVVIINPDKETETQFLVNALDICKEAGIQKISIASKKKND